ncbi:MAG: amino acid ABC transporter permease [Clostridia bacterium]|nr:amino acid ABC transporter permease [Oscillospiraceae bacterium]MBQ7032051.1 amino acid ABC transporter permease [Clostridia bacterium]
MDFLAENWAHVVEWFSYSGRILPSLLQGGKITLLVFALTLVLSLPLGLVFGLMRISKIPPLRWIASAYIWVLRGTPLLLQLYFVYYGLPSMGLTLEAIPSAVVAFTLNYSAYFAEIYRGGIQSIDRGQYEAAKALGYTGGQTMWKIIIPQTLSRIIPPITNETITLVKDTALITSISISELLRAAKGAVNRDLDTTAFLLAAILYLFFTLILTIIFKFTEKRFSRHIRRES